MSARPRSLSQAEELIQNNLQEACSELSAWWDTGLLRDGIIRSAAKLIPVGISDPIQMVERLVEQAAVRLVRDWVMGRLDEIVNVEIKSTCIFGFAAIPGRTRRHWMVWPASSENGEVKCEDISGFLGSWKMSEAGKFFPAPPGDPLNHEVLEAAMAYAKEQENAAHQERP